MKQEDFRPDLIPSIRQLEIHAKRSVLSSTLTGNWISRFRGHGIEFGGYRTYTAADDASLIDWKASVRSKKLLVKELQEEKNLNIFIFLDVSDTMLFGTTDKLKAEYAAEVVAGFSYAALRSGESVSLTMFAEKVTRFVAPSQGVASHALLMKTIANTKYYGGAKNFAKASTQLLGVMPVAGLIVIVSDFVGFDSVWEHHIKVMGSRYDVVAMVIRDPRDRRLPASGEYVLADPSTNEKLVIDVADYAKPYSEYVAQEEHKIERLMHALKSDALFLETTMEDYSKPIIQFFERHGRRVGE